MLSSPGGEARIIHAHQEICENRDLRALCVRNHPLWNASTSSPCGFEMASPQQR